MSDILRRDYAEQLKQDYLKSGFKQGFEAGYAKAKEDFDRPHGEWKYESYGQYLSTYKCSNCGFHGDKQWICCPYCGADMREGDEK